MVVLVGERNGQTHPGAHPGTGQEQGRERSWTGLPADVREGLQKTTETVAKQMKVYDARVQSVH